MPIKSFKCTETESLFNPDCSLEKCVIPANAGIQLINNSPRKWDNIIALPAAQSNFYDWIPAFAGMTAYWIIWV